MLASRPRPLTSPHESKSDLCRVLLPCPPSPGWTRRSCRRLPLHRSHQSRSDWSPTAPLHVVAVGTRYLVVGQLQEVAMLVFSAVSICSALAAVSSSVLPVCSALYVLKLLQVACSAVLPVLFHSCCKGLFSCLLQWPKDGPFFSIDIKLDGSNCREWSFSVRTVVRAAGFDDEDEAMRKTWRKSDSKVIGALIFLCCSVAVDES